MSTLKFMIELDVPDGTCLVCDQVELGEGIELMVKSLLKVWATKPDYGLTVVVLPADAVAVNADALLALQKKAGPTT